jgi:DDE family transposase
MQIQSLYDVYSALPDSRTAEGKRFNQAGVLALITLALIAQQNSLRQISAWVAACDPALGARLGFRFGRMPSYGTIRRILLQLDLTALRPALARWAHTFTRTLPVTDAPAAPLLPLAIDGKTLCGSADGPDTPATRVLSAFAHDLGTTLAQVPIPATTTEAGTLPALLTDLVLEGTIVSGDAHYTTREVIATIREKRGTTFCGSKTISHGFCAA